jgi:hypothetical protein
MSAFEKVRLTLGLILVTVAGVVGAVVGYHAGRVTVTRAYPLPHHIPSLPGGATLRFAMVHDVIHERYPYHGRDALADQPALRGAWPAVYEQFIHASQVDPRLLTRFDMIGDRLDRGIDPSLYRCFRSWQSWGGVGMNRFAAHHLKQYPEGRESSWVHANNWGPAKMREEITRVGAEEGWTVAVPAANREPVAFDEPVLAILSMWRSAGATPEFALTLGEIMMRVGQREIAWCAYERAVQLQDGFSPDAEVVRKIVSHCRGRQAVVESQSPLPAEVRRARFEAELAFGQRLRTYEKERIHAGVDLTDPQFYEAFESEQGRISTPVGPEDEFLVRHDSSSQSLDPDTDAAVDHFPWPNVLLFAGLFAFGTAVVVRLLFWGIRRLSAVSHSPPPAVPPSDAITV